jgi:Flp pilus assembly protein TadD
MVLNDLGLCYARQGDLARAEQLFRKAVEQRPREVRYGNNLATVLVRSGNTAGALEVLNPIVGQAAAHYNVAHFLNEEGKSSEAWRHFDQAAELDPTLADARLMANRLASHAPLGPSR